MDLLNLFDKMISRLNKTLKTEPQTLTDAEKALVRDNIHAADKGEWCNPNLLDNWYFGNPINQRGQTSYNNFDYTIDRYRIWDSQGTVAIEDGYLTINNNTEGNMTFVQHFDVNRMKSLLGKTLTQSILLEDGSLYSHTFTVPDNITDFFPHIVLKENTYVYFAIFGSAQSYQPIRFLLAAGTSLDIKAVKLEYGTTQTLAHQDANGNWVLNEIPNYIEELLKCQNYARVYKDVVVYCYLAGYITGIPFESHMRKAPSVSSINIVKLPDKSNVSYGNSCVSTIRGITYFSVPNATVGEFYRITNLVLSSDL